MLKKPTGIEFTPQEFRLLGLCLQCGKAGNIKKGSICESCALLGLKPCNICGILLRNGVYTFYTYDIKEDHREGGVQFKASKEYVREFIYQKEYLPHNGETCTECVDRKGNLKDKCFMCGDDFPNTKEHYLEHGNTCQRCVGVLTEIENYLPGNNDKI